VLDALRREQTPLKSQPGANQYSHLWMAGAIEPNYVQIANTDNTTYDSLMREENPTYVQTRI
jgi:hypothetical protein